MLHMLLCEFYVLSLESVKNETLLMAEILTRLQIHSQYFVYQWFILFYMPVGIFTDT